MIDFRDTDSYDGVKANPAFITSPPVYAGQLGEGVIHVYG